jgi:hypothetical protein
MSPPVSIGTEVAVRLCTLIDPEAGKAFMDLVNGHRPVPVSMMVDGAWTTPHEECGAYGCGQIWPCSTRQALDIIEALVMAKK